MNPMHKQILCQTCPDKKRAQHAVDDAKRIGRRLQDLMRKQVNGRRRGHYSTSLFHTSVRCGMTGNSCSKFSLYEGELRQAEQELEEVFAALLEHLKENDEKEARSLRHAAFELLRGHYPQAARLVMRP
jgi:hypothetical protein